jgi:hypothetical protein
LESFVHQKLTKSPILGPLDRSSDMRMIIETVKYWCVVLLHPASSSTLIIYTPCYVSSDEKGIASLEWRAV